MSNQKLTKLAKGILLAAALVTSVIACGKKNQDNNQNINAFTQSCVNCQNISGFPFFTAQATAYKSSYGYGYGYTEAFKVNLSFSGQNLNSQTQYNNSYGQQQYGSGAMSYVGQVSAAGQLTVVNPASVSAFCPTIPPGSYNLTTQTVGQWNAGQISGLKLLISGAINMTATLTQAQASEYYGGYGGYQSGTGNRLSGTLQIDQINGFNCQGATVNLW